MVDVVGFVDMVSKYKRYSRQGRQSLAWDNKTVTLLCISEQPMFSTVYIAFTIKQALRHRGMSGPSPLKSLLVPPQARTVPPQAKIEPRKSNWLGATGVHLAAGASPKYCLCLYKRE